MNPLKRTCFYVALMSLPALALAQAKTRPDPMDAKARVPLVVYSSPFARYQPLKDEPVVDWKSANDTVDKAGGWKAYAREVQEPQAGGRADNAGSKPAAKPPAPQSHKGHMKE